MGVCDPKEWQSRNFKRFDCNTSLLFSSCVACAARVMQARPNGKSLDVAKAAVNRAACTLDECVILD